MTVTVDGVEVKLPKGMILAAALLQKGQFPLRDSPVHEKEGPKARAPYCMMGVCFECLVEVDGRPNRQSCLERVRAGMRIRRQSGAPQLSAQSEEGGALA